MYEPTAMYVCKSSCKVPCDFLFRAGRKQAGQDHQRHDHFSNMDLVSAIWARNVEVIEQR